MKNKIIVMIITFLILIGITPFIFSKLMNSKFNTMLLKIQQQEGVKIKEVENKSSYLTTDRVFLVEIPGKKINENFIKNLVVKVETKFKNLPVTNVDFFGNVEKVDLVNGENIDSFTKQIKFFVTTPDFKVFSYKVNNIDMNIADNKAKFITEDIKGIYSLKTMTNDLKIKNVSLKAKNGFIQLKNIHNISSYKDTLIHTENRFDVYALFENNKFQINNIRTLTDTKMAKKTDINVQLSFDKFISSYVSIDNFVTKLSLLNLDTEALKELANNYEDRNNIELLKKGFDIVFSSKTKDINFMQNDLGSYLVKADVKVKPNPDIEEDIKKKHLDFVTSHIYYESSPQIATLIMNSVPESAFVFALAKKSGDKVVLDMVLKDSKLTINGEEIK